VSKNQVSVEITPVFPPEIWGLRGKKYTKKREGNKKKYYI